MNKLEFDYTIQSLQESGYRNIMPIRQFLKIPNAKKELWDCLSRFVAKPQWLPEYDDVVAWLENNEGRGLLCLGNCGRGKTLVCSRFIPVLEYLFYKKFVSCYDAIDLNNKIDEMKQKNLVSVDDIGTESEYLRYGEHRQPFSELVDSSEKTGMLLLLTTNLTTEQLKQRYGIHTYDRLHKLTKVVQFIGDSLR